MCLAAVTQQYRLQMQCPLLQKQKAAEFKREATERLDNFARSLTSEASVQLSAKNLGDEGVSYIINSMAFNSRYMNITTIIIIIIISSSNIITTCSSEGL